MTTGAIIAVALSIAVPAAAQTPSATPQQVKRRNQIQVMEGVLARSGAIAAEAIATQLQQLDPSMTVLIGNSRARGFVLEGYGIFFDVEVPELRGAVVWSQLTLQRDMQIGNALGMLKRALQEMPDGPNRQQALQAIRLLDVHAGPVQSPQVPPAAASDSAVRVNEGTTVVEPVAANPGLAAVMRDPNREYRDAVQRELTDAMLDYAVPMDIAPDEWLSVGARVAEAGQRGQTLMLRVKGSDLAIYATDKTRRDEVRGRVEVRVF